MCLSLSLDIGWDCQWVSPKGKWFKTKTHSATRICGEYQLRLPQNVHGWCWLALLIPARGHRSNLLSFPWRSSDKALWHPSLEVCPKAAVFLLQLVPRNSHSSRIWPSLKCISHGCMLSTCIFLLSLPWSYLRNPNYYPTCLFLCDSQSQQNFILSFNCVACLNSQIEFQIVYSLKIFQKWPGI